MANGLIIKLEKLGKSMKKIFRTVAALAVVMFAGCTTDLENEVVAPGVGAGQTTVTVGIEDTKTYLGELVDGARKVYWNSDDQIAINGVASSAIERTEDHSAAAFTFEAELTHPYSVLYPAESYKDAQTITLPAVQDSATGSYGKDAAPMAAYAEAEGAVTLHHLAGVVRLQVKLPADSKHGHHALNKVELRGVAGEQLSGDFAIDYQAVTLAGLSTDAEDKVAVAKVNKTLSAEEAKDVFVVVPAQDYAQGISVRLIDDAGHYMDIVSKAMTIAKGEIKAMPVVEFVPTGTLVGVEISSAQDLVNFAKAYNAGEYAEVEPLNVVIKNDIVFDEATNAAWTPIGTATSDYEGALDNYFAGCVDGQGYSIKNWNSVRPLFAYTDASVVIENLTIDASCTLTPNHADGNQYYGAFVGYHRGLLINCHVNANLVASGDWTGSEPHIGALVGRVVVGHVENCTVNGDVTVDKTVVTDCKNTYAGGAVGRVSNEAGVLKNIIVNGNVTLRAGSTYIAEGSANNSDAYIKYGGVVGQLVGTCTDCHLPNATQKFFYGNYVYDGGPTDQVNNNFRTQSIGGVAGEVLDNALLSNCTNYAAVTFNQYNGETNGTSSDVSRYLYAGGIAGLVYGEVSNCTMYASISNRSSCLQQFIGGVVGNVQTNAAVHYCANEGAEIGCGTTSLGYYQARNNNIGGVIGVTYSGNISNLTNKSKINCSRMNSKNSASLSMGGIIGKVESDIEIDGKGAIINYGDISSSHTQYGNDYTAIAGVVGEAKGSVKGVINEGKAYYTIGQDGAVYKNNYVAGVVAYANGAITIDSSENKGGAYINISKSVDQKHYNLCVGGIVGTNKDGNAVTISNCTNSGSAAIQGGGSKVNGRSVAVGGIVGALTNGASSVSTCTNVGCVSNTSSNNTTSAWVIRAAGGSNYIGGIAGYVEGAEGDLLEVTNCVNNRTEGTSDKIANGSYAIYTLRGAVGALVGGAKYGDVKNGEVTTFIYNTNSTVTGGLVGAITNSNVDNCVLTDSSLNPHTGCNACGGGIGQTVASTVSNITLNGVTILEPNPTNTGAIVGNSDAASTYSNIKVKGSIGGTAITASSPMIAINAGATIDVTILE